jgi:hypothetical protein
MMFFYGLNSNDFSVLRIKGNQTYDLKLYEGIIVYGISISEGSSGLSE